MWELDWWTTSSSPYKYGKGKKNEKLYSEYYVLFLEINFSIQIEITKAKFYSDRSDYLLSLKHEWDFFWN